MHLAKNSYSGYRVKTYKTYCNTNIMHHRHLGRFKKQGQVTYSVNKVTCLKCMEYFYFEQKVKSVEAENVIKGEV